MARVEMYADKTSLPSDLIEQATNLAIRVSVASVSLLQRHFRLDYSSGVVLAQALEDAGIITAPGLDGHRRLTPHALSLRREVAEPTARELCESWACDPFQGGDGGDIGSSHAPSIWLFGQEHGDSLRFTPVSDIDQESYDYSIDKQLRYPFNRNAFKLFAAIEGEPVTHYEQFARKHQPWVPGATGFFKGNLYPYPCRNLSTWTEQAAAETGFARKDEFVAWCNEHRLPAIADAVKRHRPRLFIGIGSNTAREFSLAYFGAAVPLETYQFAVGGYTKKIRYATYNGGRFVVLPHISNGANGLNSDDALQIAGSFIAGLMR